jgi:hypothetical protein
VLAHWIVKGRLESGCAQQIILNFPSGRFQWHAVENLPVSKNIEVPRRLFGMSAANAIVGPI